MCYVKLDVLNNLEHGIFLKPPFLHKQKYSITDQFRNLSYNGIPAKAFLPELLLSSQHIYKFIFLTIKAMQTPIRPIILVI